MPSMRAYLALLALVCGCTEGVEDAGDSPTEAAEQKAFTFEFSSDGFFREDTSQVGGATIREHLGAVMDRPGDGFEQRRRLNEQMNVEHTGVTLFTGEGSYLRFAGAFSRDYLNFSVDASDQYPLRFRRDESGWRYLAGCGTVVSNGTEYRLGGDRELHWFMAGLSSKSPFCRESAVLELIRYPVFLESENVVDTVSGLLGDPSPFVKRSAAFVAGKMKLARCLPIVIKQLTDMEIDQVTRDSLLEAMLRIRKE
jgi:hypothetical protein